MIDLTIGLTIHGGVGMASEREAEEKVTEFLLVFVDILYAVVFGLILAETYAEIILANIVDIEQFFDKLARMLLIIGVFYFLTWDWLHGRLLTVKNPFTRYRRFFFEVIIAFCGYGAARTAVNGEITFLVFIFLILGLGAFWANSARREHPESKDKREFVGVLCWCMNYIFLDRREY